MPENQDSMEKKKLDTNTVQKAGTFVLIIATSLNPDSNSLRLARQTQANLNSKGVENELISLRDLPLPLCDGTQEISHHPNAWALRLKVRKATHILFALPIYNYSVNAAAKNVLELLFNWGCWYENEWDDFVVGKTAGLLCAGGGEHSRMAALSFANSLMMECHWWVVPRFVYATGKDFADGEIKNAKIIERINTLIHDLLKGPKIVLEEIA